MKAIQADPTSLNLTYNGAIPPAPVNINAAAPNGMDTVCKNMGCMDQNAVNYDPTATCPGSNNCVAKLYGCLKKDNAMYNPWANTHDERFCSKVTAF